MRVSNKCIVVVALGVLGACGGSDADELGIGAECEDSDQCEQSEDFEQICLTQFTGGYCGLADCVDDLDCPEDSACIAHTDSVNYCFRTCADKAECNANRSVDNESNCSSSVTFVDGADGRKACVPPSSGG
jgi:hypothetical protein